MHRGSARSFGLQHNHEGELQVLRVVVGIPCSLLGNRNRFLGRQHVVRFARHASIVDNTCGGVPSIILRKGGPKAATRKWSLALEAMMKDKVRISCQNMVVARTLESSWTIDIVGLWTNVGFREKPGR